MIPPIAAGPGTDDVLPCRLGGRPQNGSDPLDAVVEAEFRNSSRPGSQAPHAPPALTFGLPGKQTVKPTRTRRDLMRGVRGLPAANVGWVRREVPYPADLDARWWVTRLRR